MRYLQTFEKFNKVAFHGYLMNPKDMKLPECEIEWKPGSNIGCPSFSDAPKITQEDEKTAIEYLNQEEIGTLIAYSRGGAVLLQSLTKGAELPERVYLVAPAWKRKWSTVELTGAEIKGANGFIIHGGKDNKVPVAHSVLLSKMSGLPLYVYPECDHVNILKYKDNIEGAIKIDQKSLDDLLSKLPDWGEDVSKPEQVTKQYQIIKEI